MKDSSEDFESFSQEMQLKVKYIIEAFKKYGYNDSNALIRKEDIIRFLNTSSNSSEFNPNLTQKLFDILEIGQKPSIKIADFASGFVFFESEIRRKCAEFHEGLNKEKILCDKNEILCNKKKNSGEKCGDFVAVSVEIGEILMRYGGESVGKVVVEVELGGERREVCVVWGRGRREEVGKSVEFEGVNSVSSMKISFKAYDLNDNYLIYGNKTISMDLGVKDHKQNKEELPMKITVPDINNPNKIVATINTKLSVYFSGFLFYDEQLQASREKIQKLERRIQRSNVFLREITAVYSKENTPSFNNNIKSTGDYKESKVGGNEELIESGGVDGVIDVGDIGVNNNISDGNINITPEEPNITYNLSYGKPLRLLGTVIFIIGVFSLLTKADYPNICCGLIVVLGMEFLKRNVNDKGNKAVIFLLFTIIFVMFYDMFYLWGGLNETASILDKSGSLEDIINLISYLSLGFKAITLYILNAQRLELVNLIVISGIENTQLERMY